MRLPRHLILAALFSAAPPGALAAGADDFEVTLVASGLDHPVALARAPDGLLFVTEKSGKVRIVDADGLRTQPFADLEVHVGGENGLLGIAIDPRYADNGYVYLFASVSDQEQQIIRLRNRDGLGVEPVVIRDNLPTTGDVHSGGCLRFGPDGFLYFSIGDNGDRANPQNLTTLSGKICRIRADGSTPDDNPFKTPTGSPRAVWALGFRNPFRFCFAPDGRMFVMDVGSDGDQRREEINIIRRGDNAGWPTVEGNSSLSALFGFVEPLVAYHDEGAAVTAGVFYTGRQFPPEYRGDLFHLEYVLNRLYKLELDGDQLVRHEIFLQLGGGVVDLIQDRDGALLYTELYTGAVKRIAYAGPAFEDPDAPPDEDPPADGGDDDLPDESGDDDGGAPDPGDDADDDNDDNDDGDSGQPDASNDNAADDQTDPDDNGEPSLVPRCGLGALGPAGLVLLALTAGRRRPTSSAGLRARQ